MPNAGAVIFDRIFSTATVKYKRVSAGAPDQGVVLGIADQGAAVSRRMKSGC